MWTVPLDRPRRINKNKDKKINRNILHDLEKDQKLRAPGLKATERNTKVLLAARDAAADADDAVQLATVNVATAEISLASAKATAARAKAVCEIMSSSLAALPEAVESAEISHTRAFANVVHQQQELRRVQQAAAIASARATAAHVTLGRAVGAADSVAWWFLPMS